MRGPERRLPSVAWMEANQKKSERIRRAIRTLVLGVLATVGGAGTIYVLNATIPPGVNGHLLCRDGKSTGPYSLDLEYGQTVTLRGSEGGGIVGNLFYEHVILVGRNGYADVQEGNFDGVNPDNDNRIFNPYPSSESVEISQEAKPNGVVTVIFEATSCPNY